ncbi:hypothetical protein QTP86_005036 [Hemibagrus guttatus]|nr:hypothetical protein QTP86_005036 [Hemibagrus guttatus]
MSSKGHVRVVSKPKNKKVAKIRKATAAQGLFDIIDNFDREATTYADTLYAGTDTYANAFENEPGKRIPKAGAKAEAGVGRAGAAWSIFAVEANGPNASAEATANGLEAGAMAVAELGSVSAVAGPIEARLGLAIDTGVSVSPTKIEAKFLGSGVSIGTAMGISLFGMFGVIVSNLFVMGRMMTQGAGVLTIV